MHWQFIVALLLPFVIVTCTVFYLSLTKYIDYHSIKDTILVSTAIGTIATMSYLGGFAMRQYKESSRGGEVVKLDLS